MPQDQLYVDPHPPVVELLRLSILDLLEKCTDFATEVEEAEAETGCMSLITIQMHLAYLRGKAMELGGRMQ